MTEINTQENEENRNNNRVINENSCEHLNINEKIFGQEYNEFISTLNKLKETKDYFLSISSKIEDKSNLLFNEINDEISTITKKITYGFDLENSADICQKVDEKKTLLIQNYTKNFLKKYEKILKMNNQILESIRENIDVLLNFYEINSEYLDEEKPTHKFIDDQLEKILINWMFLKIDFHDYDFVKTFKKLKLSEEIKDLIFLICNNKSYKMNLSYESSKPDGKIQKEFHGLLKRTHNNLTSLRLENMSDLDNYFKENNTYECPKLNKLSIYGCEIKSNERNQFFNFFPSVKKTKISYCIDSEFQTLKFLPMSLKELYLTKNNFVNSDFSTIFSAYILKSDNFRKNIEILSFADNSITKIDFNSIIPSQKYNLPSLKIMDFHKNQIYKFGMNSENFPALKYINCCYNNFANNYFNEYKNILVLQSGNSYLTDNVLCANYYNNLENKLKNFNYPLNKLIFSFIPGIFSNVYIPKVIISSNLLINLRKLDLSYNNLNNDSVISFLKNNKQCFNLKCINLDGNDLDENFFELFLANKLNLIFDKLQKITLNKNKFGDFGRNINYRDEDEVIEINKNYEKEVYKLRILYKFLEQNKKLDIVSITRNPMSNYFCIKDRMERLNTEYNRKNKNGEIIINGLYSFLLKVKEELVDNKERENLIIKFDCRTKINQESKNFAFDKQFIVFKKDE